MRWLFMLSAAIIPFSAATQVSAGEGAVCCPHCHHVCEVSAETEKVKKYCWEVECKPICIPRITFPWQSCCEPKCAKLKYVNVLKKHEYECEHCKFKFTPVPVPCGCPDHSGYDGDAVGCQARLTPVPSETGVVQASATANLGCLIRLPAVTPLPHNVNQRP